MIIVEMKMMLFKRYNQIQIIVFKWRKTEKTLLAALRMKMRLNDSEQRDD